MSDHIYTQKVIAEDGETLPVFSIQMETSRIDTTTIGGTEQSLLISSFNLVMKVRDDIRIGDALEYTQGDLVHVMRVTSIQHEVRHVDEDGNIIQNMTLQGQVISSKPAPDTRFVEPDQPEDSINLEAELGQ